MTLDRQEFEALIKELEEQRNMAFTRCTMLARKVSLLGTRVSELKDEVAAANARADTAEQAAQAAKADDAIEHDTPGNDSTETMQ